MLPAGRNVSPLESLPIELREASFFQTLSVNIPLASSHLWYCLVLDSHEIRTPIESLSE